MGAPAAAHCGGLPAAAPWALAGVAACWATPSQAPTNTWAPGAPALKQSNSKKAGGTRGEGSLSITPSLENSTALKGHPREERGRLHPALTMDATGL